MMKEKKIGIWMDHSNAHLIEFTDDLMKTKIISSNFSNHDKEKCLERSESHMHNRERHQHAGYYKKLGDIIRHYKDVILFGPTVAKVELFNRLKTNHLFSKIRIGVQQADKMTELQQHAFVKWYFT
jgi:hypothetical protein